MDLTIYKDLNDKFFKVYWCVVRFRYDVGQITMYSISKIKRAMIYNARLIFCSGSCSQRRSPAVHISASGTFRVWRQGASSPGTSSPTAHSKCSSVWVSASGHCCCHRSVVMLLRHTSIGAILPVRFGGHCRVDVVNIQTVRNHVLN